MVTLPPKIRKNGFTYTLVSRGRRACLYKQRVTEKIHYYEVFILRLGQEKNIFGKILPSKEIFPRNEDFGKFAWSFRTITEAKKKFYRLEREMNLHL